MLLSTGRIPGTLHVAVLVWTSFNAAEMAVPKILHQMLCTAASDQVMAALGCGKREIVFAGSGGLLYLSYDGPSAEMAPPVKVFYTTGQ